MRAFLVISVLILPFICVGQISELEKARIIERSIEFINEQTDGVSLDYTAFLDHFYHFLDHPVNLNQAEFDDLQELYILTDIQCQAIIHYRKRYGQFLTVYELGAIELLDQNTIDFLLPFVYIGDPTVAKTNWKNVFTKGKNEVLIRYQRVIEQKQGYANQIDSIQEMNPNGSYLGDENKYFLRCRYNYHNKLSYGILAEKDPGEQFFKGSQKQGFDFYSGHIMVRDIGPVKKVIAGDFQANFGQGLTLWTGFNPGLSPNVLNVKQYGTGIRASTSANESNYFRGVATTFGNNQFEVTTFGSFNRIDANLLNPDSLENDNAVTAFQMTGYHRTLSEIEKKDRINRMVLGGAASYKNQKLKLNFTGIYSKYNLPVQLSDQAYKAFSFSGNRNLSVGADYQIVFNRMSLFGEFSTAYNGKVSTVNGILWRIDQAIDIVFLHRYFDKATHLLYSNNFSSRSSNENGIYIGARARVSKKVDVSFYLDQSQSSWLKYQVNGPSVQRQLFTQLNYKISRYSSLYIRYRNRYQEGNSKVDDSGVLPQEDKVNTNVRINYTQRVNTQISLRSRIEWCSYKFGNTKSKGFLMFQDVIYSFRKIPLKVYSRYALFDTDDYNSRIYAYENDLLYVFNVPAYYYQGARTYLMFRYDFKKRMAIWLKWSRFAYANQSTISSGLEKIDDNTRSEIKVQLRLKF